MLNRSFRQSANVGVSIRKWINDITGSTNQRDAFLLAMQDTAAAQSVLVIDCPVRLDTTGGNEMYIPTGTRIAFEGSGVIYGYWDTNPLFIALHSSFEFEDFDLLYMGPGLDASINYNTSPGADPGWAVNARLKTRMMTYHGNTFIGSGGPIWYGPHHYMCAFSLLGNSFGKFRGDTTFRVPTNATADNFIPWIIAGKGQWLEGLTGIATGSANTTPNPNVVQPNLQIDNLTVDGALMGIQGEFNIAEIQRTRSYRYSDLMASDGSLIGGVASNGVPPPHLFYFNERCDHININDTVDYGIWVTTNADPKARRSTSSGSCCSLKVGAQRGMISGYKSYRPDGFADLLGDQPGYGQSAYSLEDFYAEYDSTVCGNLFPAIRFPIGPYIGLSIRNGKLVDKASTSAICPLGSGSDSGNLRVTISNVETVVNDFSGTNFSGTYFNGAGHDIDVTHIFKAHTQSQTYRGVLAYQGNAGLQVANTVHKAKVIGWRNFAASPVDMRNRLVMNGGSSGTNPNSNYAELIDVTNNHKIVQMSGQKTETWIQKVVVTPTAGVSSVSTGISIPANWKVTQVSCGPRSTVGMTTSGTGFSIGWSGETEGLGAVVGLTTSSRLFLTDLPIVSSATARPIIITGTGGNFTGTGTIELIVEFTLNTIGE